ncbi:hypothetical protein [Metabacillus litoralis]|uniref:hypothetical protein n=1 Tax=Metabacillus litoralis TaxID=152268 RepID=UPI00203AED97|nr:hypothetical protein [Metabacillus litoralis]
MSLDTARIGTEKGLDQRNKSRYCENRDRKREKEKKRVSILRELGQIKGWIREISLDTARIGTDKGMDQRNKSRYCENRDRKRVGSEK